MRPLWLLTGIAILLRGGKLASQRILLQRIGFIVGQWLIILRLIALSFTSSALLGHPLRR